MLISKALADETRVRIIMALSRGELCVCQITDLLGLAPATVSKHLSILRNARMVSPRKEKRWVYYRLADNTAPRQVRDALKWVQTSLKDDKRILKDIKNLRVKAYSEELCKN